MRCITWNVNWAKPGGERWGLIENVVRRVSPEVACFTEIYSGSLDSGWVIESEPDYGCRMVPGRRKVLLWSKSLGWEEVDTMGDPSLPSGRFVSGVVHGIRFVGVCIPWDAAHVRTGQRNKRRWEEHIAFCRGLGQVLARYAKDGCPVCLLGDLNQRIPRKGQPKRVAAALEKAVPEGFSCPTQDVVDIDRKPLVDHLILSDGLRGGALRVISKVDGQGRSLSDHAGVCLKIRNLAQVR